MTISGYSFLSGVATRKAAYAEVDVEGAAAREAYPRRIGSRLDEGLMAPGISRSIA